MDIRVYHVLIGSFLLTFFFILTIRRALARSKNKWMKNVAFYWFLTDLAIGMFFLAVAINLIP